MKSRGKLRLVGAGVLGTLLFPSSEPGSCLCNQQAGCLSRTCHSWGHRLGCIERSASGDKRTFQREREGEGERKGRRGIGRGKERERERAVVHSPFSDLRELGRLGHLNSRQD